MPEELSASVDWNSLHHVWDEIADVDMRLIYRAYQRPLGIKGRIAVVAIDLYDKAFEGGPLPPRDLQDTYPSSCGKYAHAAIAPISAVFAACRSASIPIIHITANVSGTAVVASNRQPDRLEFAGRESRWAFRSELAPVADELVVVKERASAFYGTQLVAELVSRNVDTIVVVGQTTSGCVRASVVDAYSNGFHTVVVEDGVFDRSWLNHQVNLFDLHHKYADVMDAKTVIGLLARLRMGAER